MSDSQTPDLDAEIQSTYAALEELAAQQSDLHSLLGELKRRRAIRDERLARARLNLQIGEGQRTIEQVRSFLADWRPLTALTLEAAKRHPLWMLKFCDEVTDIYSFSGDPEGMHRHHILPRLDHERAIPGQNKCRLIDKDGLPVPWSEVGL